MNEIAQPHARAPRFDIRIASGDEDVKRIFHFLVFVSIPSQLAPVNAIDAVNEVNRVVAGSDAYAAGTVDSLESFAVVAEIKGEIVGTLGIIKVPWWYNHEAFFLADRWFFTFPALYNKGIGAALEAEAAALAAVLNLDLIIHGKFARRNKAHGRGVIFAPPTIVRANKEKQ